MGRPTINSTSCAFSRSISVITKQRQRAESSCSGGAAHPTKELRTPQNCSGSRPTCDATATSLTRHLPPIRRQAQQGGPDTGSRWGDPRPSQDERSDPQLLAPESGHRAGGDDVWCHLEEEPVGVVAPRRGLWTLGSTRPHWPVSPRTPMLNWKPSTACTNEPSTTHSSDVVIPSFLS